MNKYNFLKFFLLSFFILGVYNISIAQGHSIKPPAQSKPNTPSNPKAKKQWAGSQPTGDINGYKYVDLGLPSGLLWATYNVDAVNPSDYGGYYMWGETETHPQYVDYIKENYSFLHKGFMDISGNPLADVAAKKWGAPWRIPRKFELQELIDECEWKRMSSNGHKGFLITGPNGNSIFIPAAGEVEGDWAQDFPEYRKRPRTQGLFPGLWSATSKSGGYVLASNTNPDDEFYKHLNWDSHLWDGLNIRPVSNGDFSETFEIPPITDIHLNRESGVLRRDIFFKNENPNEMSLDELYKITDLAQILYQHYKAKVEIIGYAFIEDSTNSSIMRNAALHANTVADFLKNYYDIDPSRIETRIMGQEIFQPYPEKEQNNVAICIIEY